MTRTIERTYELTERDVREGILLWLKSRPDTKAKTNETPKENEDRRF